MTDLQIFDVEGSGWRFGQDGDGTRLAGQQQLVVIEGGA